MVSELRLPLFQKKITMAKHRITASVFGHREEQLEKIRNTLILSPHAGYRIISVKKEMQNGITYHGLLSDWRLWHEVENYKKRCEKLIEGLQNSYDWKSVTLLYED